MLCFASLTPQQQQQLTLFSSLCLGWWLRFFFSTCLVFFFLPIFFSSLSLYTEAVQVASCFFHDWIQVQSTFQAITTEDTKEFVNMNMNNTREVLLHCKRSFNVIRGFENHDCLLFPCLLHAFLSFFFSVERQELLFFPFLEEQHRHFVQR